MNSRKIVMLLTTHTDAADPIELIIKGVVVADRQYDDIVLTAHDLMAKLGAPPLAASLLEAARNA